MQRNSIVFILFWLPLIISAVELNLRKLQDEFSQVGIYKPENPEQYNETRANEILQSIQSNKAYRNLAGDLRKQQLESLTKRPATSSEAELNRLKEENLQLRTHAQHLKDENVRLRKESKTLTLPPSSLSSSSNSEEIERLREEIATLKKEASRLKSASAGKAKNENQLEELQTLASRTITNLNEFERLILAAGYDLDRNYPEGALQFIRAARDQLLNIKTMRDDLSTLFE